MSWGPYGEPTKVVHVNGLRLFSDKDARGAAPAAAATALLKAAAAQQPAPAAVIITGDVAADGSPEAYALAKRLVRSAFPSAQVCYLAGAGDDAAALAKAFRPDFHGPGAGDAKPLHVSLPPPESHKSGRHNWRVVLAPSPSAGAAALKKELEDAGSKSDPHVILVLPAAPAPTAGCGGGGDVDDWGNETAADPDDPDPLCKLLDSHGCVRLVLHGGPATKRARGMTAGIVDTPAATGDGRPSYTVLSLLHYEAGGYTASTEHVKV